MNPNIDDELREQILTEFKQVHKLAPADYTENCTNVVMSMVTNKIKEAELEAVYNVFYMVWIEDGAPLQRDDPPSEILRYIEKLEGSQDER